MWPDWAIYCTLGDFTKPVATNILPKLPTLLGNLCNGVKIVYFSIEIIFWQLFTAHADWLEIIFAYLFLASIYWQFVELYFCFHFHLGTLMHKSLQPTSPEALFYRIWLINKFEQNISSTCLDLARKEIQCDQIWQNFKVFGKTLVVYLIFDKMLNLLWQILYPIGQIFIHVNGQIFDKIIEPSCHTGNYRWPSCCLKKLFLWQFVILKFWRFKSWLNIFWV